MKRVWNLIVFTIAIIYFLMDAVFATVAIPLSKSLAARWCFKRVRIWIVSLRPYPTLALFVIPLVIAGIGVSMVLPTAPAAGLVPDGILPLMRAKFRDSVDMQGAAEL